ncbi:MAG: hypothetical protein NZ932_03850 [Candidatus Bathyarchaeota archaeon]|nr:hypothetical protein [Candidatus Bathyarchaeota archaeon]MDW8022398.1 hypothetical protein [Nitrososphaerota archaeon]
MLRKSNVSTAFPLLVLMLCALIVSSFFVIGVVDACHRRPRPPCPRPRPQPPGKWIEVTILCEETGKPIPDGLAVKCEGPMNFADIKFTKNGKVLFGSGVIDGTYVISWTWCGKLWSRTVTIDCSKLIWQFEYKVPNPKIIKHFYYDAPYFDNPPIAGLDVTLYVGTTPVVTLKTDDTGTVVFDGKYVEVGKEYYLKWLWGGVEETEGPITFKYDDFGRLMNCVWEGKNYLKPKGGGGE